MLAAIVKVPEIALDPKEATALAKAATEVAKHYPVQASAKALAWINFGMVAGTVYVPRAIAISLRAKKDREEAPRPTIVPMERPH